MGTKFGNKAGSNVLPDSQRTVSNGANASYQQVIDIRLLEFNNLGGSSVNHGNVYAGKDTNGTTVNLRTISAGRGITIEEFPNEIKVHAGVDLDAVIIGVRSAPGDGQVIFSGVTDGTLVLKRIRAGDDSVLVSSSANSVDIRVNAAKFGDVKGAANVGDAGTGLYLTKTAGILGFRNLVPSTRLSVTPTANNLLLDVIESGIDVANTKGSLSTNRVLGLHKVAVSGAYNDLSGLPTVFSGEWDAILNKPLFHKVATTGSYADLKNLPALHAVAISGNYADLVNKPVQFDGEWLSIKNKPDFAKVATTGSFTDLKNIPPFHIVSVSGDYYDLKNRPAPVVLTWESITNKPAFHLVATSGSYADLKNLPDLKMVAVTGSYFDLKDKPTPFDAEWTSIKNKPTFVSKLSDLSDYAAGPNPVTDYQVLMNFAGKWQPYTLPSTDPLTTTGDLTYRSSTKTDRLAIGATDEVLTVVGGLPKWQKPKVVAVVSDSGPGVKVTATTSATGTVTVRGELTPLAGGAPSPLDYWTPVVDTYGRTTGFNPPESYPLSTSLMPKTGDTLYGGGGANTVTTLSTGPGAAGRYLHALPDSTLEYSTLFAANGCVAMYMPNSQGVSIPYGLIISMNGDGVWASRSQPIVGVCVPNAGLALNESPFGSSAGPYLLGSYGEILRNNDNTPKMNPSYTASHFDMRPRSSIPAQWVLVGFLGMVYVNLAPSASTVAPGSFIASNSTGYGVVSSTATSITVLRLTKAPTSSEPGIAQCMIK